MTDNQNDKYIYYTKMAWTLYALLTVVLIFILVFFVARDTEEKFFYTIMPAAGAYVFRPTERFMNKLIFRFTGMSKPEEQE